MIGWCEKLTLTRKQEEGLRIAVERWRNGEKYTVIGGFAGAGKSTLIKFIIAAMGLSDEEVRYAAYTGKAANVLKNKGCPGATTVHKLIYHARLQSSGKYRFIPKTPGEIRMEGIKVVVIDEVSMLPTKMWNLLCSYPFYIIAAGDPEQLPPIMESSKEDPNNHVLDNPHIFLDEIMRQAQESEIIRLSMHIREGKSLNSFPCVNEQVMLIDKRAVNNDVLKWADQILCATNRTKVEFNKRLRQAYGFQDAPQLNDKVINLHNEWDISSTIGNPLTNGIIGNIKSMSYDIWEYPGFIREKTGKISVPILWLTISGDEPDEEFQELPFDYSELVSGNSSLSPREEYLVLTKLKQSVPLHGNFGYAVTVWKAQGSEWDKVLLYPERSWPRDTTERRKFLYTGVTRARQKLVVAKE